MKRDALPLSLDDRSVFARIRLDGFADREVAA